MFFFVAGLILLVVGAEALVRGASRVAATVGVSPLVIGLTVVAFGTSAPELAVSTSSTLAGDADVAVGNVVGSNIFNVLFILGLSALVAPLAVSAQLLKFDLRIMIGVSVLLFVLVLDGNIGRLDGILLFSGIVAYTGWAIIASRRATAALVEEYSEECGEKEKSGRGILVDLLLVVAGLGLLVLGSDWFVGAATDFAEALGVSQMVIGLTLVAAGTSMPELATSVIASIKGERDIAVGNVVGSNIFNILSVLGAAGMVADGGIAVADSARNVDIPVMIGVAVVCAPIFFTGAIARWHGLLFIGLYVAYVFYLYLHAQESESLATFSSAMVLAVIPMTVVAVCIGAFRAYRTRGLQRT